jgi:CRISPR-associated protein Csb1
VAPAKYSSRGQGATYVFEDRFVEGGQVKTVLIDARTSVANRLECALGEAIDDGHPVLSLMPRIRVSYQFADGTSAEFYDYELPHRYSDGHIRSGSVDGVPVVQVPAYRAARDATPANASPLLALSPLSLILGGWDSTRKSRQGRYAAAFTGEVVGVLAEPTSSPTRRSGARIDPVAASVRLTKEAFESVARAQAEDDASVVGLPKKDGDGLFSASKIGLGAIPPGTESLDGIATKVILRSNVVSFSTLRRLRFGTSKEADVAVRALLAAIVLNGMARANSELFLRANCHLVEAEAPTFVLDQRYGNKVVLKPLTVDAADELVQQAFELAQRAAGLDWHGQVLEVRGHSDLAGLVGAAESASE